MYYGQYDKFLLAGDFNVEDTEPILSSFLEQYEAKNIVKNKTCFKSIENPSCVDLLITNSCRSFQHTNVFSTGLSDFHKMAVTVLKTTFVKSEPKWIYYRDYKKYVDGDFRNDLKKFLTGSLSYEDFEKIFLDVLEIHAPLKTRLIRANEVPYMTKALKKAIMKRSELESRYYRTKREEDKTIHRKQIIM